MTRIDLPELMRSEYFLIAEVNIVSHPSIIEVLVDNNDYNSELNAFYRDFRTSDLPEISTLNEWAKMQLIECPFDLEDFGLTAESQIEIQKHYQMTTIEFLRESSLSNRLFRLCATAIGTPSMD